MTTEWQGVFCGRDEELRALQAAWHTVAGPNPSPRVVALVGESGLGKTRLIQEFYGWLSTAVDGMGADGYWPDQLERSADNLAINPPPETCNARNPMPFLWWGIRLPDPGSRNITRGGVAADVDLLKPHIGPFAEARLRRDKAKGLVRDATLEIGTEVANAFTFNLAGLAKTVTEHGSRAWEVYRADRAMRRGADLGARSEEARRDIVDMLLEDLALLLSGNPKRGRRLPVVIVLDDAQWVDQDPGTLEFVDQLLRRAVESDWPLLLVATHWEQEWRRQAREPARSFARLCRDRMPADWRPVVLGKSPDLSALVRAGLPGLTERQMRLVLEKADGNPRLVDEIIRHLRAKPRFFQGRDVAAALTDKGEQEVETASYDLHELILERLTASTLATRLALGLSGLQGVRFLKDLTGEVGRALGEEMPAEALIEAEDPLVFLARTSTATPEFVQRVYREVALEQLEDLVDPDEARKTLCVRLVRLLDASAQMEEDAHDILLGLATSLLAEDYPVRALEARVDLIARKMEANDLRGAAALAINAPEEHLAQLELTRARTLFDACNDAGFQEKALKIAAAMWARADGDDDQLAELKASLLIGDCTERFEGWNKAYIYFVGAFMQARDLSDIHENRDVFATRAEAVRAVCLMFMRREHESLSQDNVAPPRYYVDEILANLAAERENPMIRRDKREQLLDKSTAAMAIAQIDGHKYAIEMKQQALALAQEIVRESGSIRARLDLIGEIVSLTESLYQIKEFDGDKKLAKEAIQIARDLSEECRVPSTLQQLAATLESASSKIVDHEFAAEVLDEAIDFRRELYRLERTDHTARKLVRALSDQGYRYINWDMGEKGRTVFEEILEITNEKGRGRLSDAWLREQYFDALFALSMCYKVMDDPITRLRMIDNLIDDARLRISRFRDTFGVLALSGALREKAAVLHCLNRSGEGVEAAKEALFILRTTFEAPLDGLDDPQCETRQKSKLAEQIAWTLAVLFELRTVAGGCVTTQSAVREAQEMLGPRIHDKGVQRWVRCMQETGSLRCEITRFARDCTTL